MYCTGPARPQEKSSSHIWPRPNLSSASLSAIATIFLLPNRWYYLSSSWNILFTFTFQKILRQSKYLRKSVGVNLPSSQDESLKLHPSRRLALASPGWTLNFPLLTCPIIAIQVRLIICILFLLLQQEVRIHPFFLTSKTTFWTRSKFPSTSTFPSSNFTTDCVNE